MQVGTILLPEENIETFLDPSSTWHSPPPSPSSSSAYSATSANLGTLSSLDPSPPSSPIPPITTPHLSLTSATTTTTPNCPQTPTSTSTTTTHSLPPSGACPAGAALTSVSVPRLLQPKTTPASPWGQTTSCGSTTASSIRSGVVDLRLLQPKSCFNPLCELFRRDFDNDGGISVVEVHILGLSMDCREIWAAGGDDAASAAFPTTNPRRFFR
ncbi:unnamed protein product [Malus baccata var. baccata]